MGERLIFIVDAAEDLSIDSYHLVHFMRRHGLQVRISFEPEPNFDWKAEASFMKKKVEFLGGDTEQDENYWEYEEYVEKQLILNGTGVITKEGMIHLEESLNEKLEGFDFLPGLMIIPQSNMRTLRQVVYQELEEDQPYEIDSADHEGIVKIKKITEPSSHQIKEEGIKPPRLFLLHSDFEFINDILEKNNDSKRKPTRIRSPVTAFIAQEIALGEDVWQNSWVKFRDLSDRKKFNVIGEFCFTLKRSTKQTPKGVNQAVIIHEDGKEDPKKISKQDFGTLFLRALKKDPTQSDSRK